MRRSSIGISVVVGSLLGGLCLVPACGGANNNGGFTGSSSGGGSSGGSGGSSGGSGGSSSGVPSLGGSSGGGSSSGGSSSGGGGLTCPTGLQCNVSCSGGGTTTVTGTVYDPAQKNPLYNVAVYVPAVPLTPLPRGVPTGADACSCGALYESGSLTNTLTAVDGTFTLSNVPVGSAVPLVLQIGKWRRQVTIDVKECTTNAQPDKSLSLPGTVAASDTTDNMPDIAVSTGEADTLECLMLRIGIPAAEYVAGAATTGHVHVFSGGDPSGGGGIGGGGGAGTGRPETPAMTGAPESDTNLWNTVANLMPYDVLLLSCEGGETYNANPQNLESYLNAGGRAFGSHFHYAWFSGPLGSGQSYTAPADWGTNLATWTADGTTGGGGLGGGAAIGGVIDQTLNGSTAPFQNGQILSQWLGKVGALGQNGVPAAELSIYQPRYNAVVSASNKPSQPWITSDSSASSPNQTMFFSFDTPVNAPITDAGTPAYCGRAVFSDLHVGGDPTTTDTPPPPGGCDNTDLSPQEKALEFMLFDLSSCVIPDTVTVPPDAGIPPPPPK